MNFTKSAMEMQGFANAFSKVAVHIAKVLFMNDNKDVNKTAKEQYND
ncbi:hypothetical protein [Candidatus Enterococcus testudinis]|nr:hypothetical protein [Enterococcus sp. 8G7_MSG3316]